MARMHRTQVYLDPEINAALDRLARKRRTSKAHLLREAARRLVQQEQGVEDDPIWGIVGLGSVGPGNVAEEHDRFLAESEIRRWSS